MERRLWGIPALLCLALAGAAPLVAWSELNLAAARTHLDNWWAQPEADRATDARAALARARLLPASRAELALRTGQLALIDALETRRPEDFLPAVTQFEHSVAARPLWPDGHAWLAVAYARAGQLDAGTAALQRSLELGPRAGRLLTIFAPHVAAVAAIANAPAREAIYRLADRIAIREPAWTAGLMRRLGWAGAWCDRPAARELARTPCARPGTAR